MRRQRVLPEQIGSLKLFFGARTPDSLPYFGPLNKIPDAFLDTHFAFSRVDGQSKNYVQDELRLAAASIAVALKDPQTYIYICGMKAMEEGVDSALNDIAGKASLDWNTLKDEMRKSGRYHVETY
jgi:benzoyl-CoA 2,3-dioxygenase component A